MSLCPQQSTFDIHIWPVLVFKLFQIDIDLWTAEVG